MNRTTEIILDRILIVIALIALGAFLGLLGYWTAQPDLIIVLTVVYALAVWDFWVSVLRASLGFAPTSENHREGQEARR